MRHPHTLILLLIAALAWASIAASQQDNPVPTLTVPTLVPTLTPGANVDALTARSAVADIVASGEFRVGVLYNDPPYSELSQLGTLRGFDIELLRLIAETWDVDLALTQVTRQNALERLDNRMVDALASALVHYRSLDKRVEFTQTYLTGRQALMVRADSAYDHPHALVSSRIGYVIGTRAEEALRIWEGQLGIPLNSQSHLTLDKAFAALSKGEVEAVIGEEQDLLRVTRDYSDLVRFVDQPVVVEPHAFALRRQDANLRNLLNRTIQYLTVDGQLEVLFNEYFPGQEFPTDVVYLWENIGDAPLPQQYAGELRYPAQYAAARVLETGILRVGGLPEDRGAGSVSERRMSDLNRALMEEIADRWGVSVERIPSTAESVLDLLQQGAIDIAVGIQPNWRLAERVDFSTPYLLHGDRLMVPTNSRIQGFNDLRGQWIGILIGDETARERAQAWADSVNASVNFIQTPERSAGLTILDLDNADVIYANNLSLIPHLEASPNALRLTDRWYSRSHYALALRQNDIDFRLLLDYTIQELIIDGTLQRLSAPLLMSDEFPVFDIIPGEPAWSGISLSSS